MGNYASTTELVARFADDAEAAHASDSTTGSANLTVFGEVIDDAEGLANSYFGVKYLIPVSTSDTGLAARMKSVVLDIAVYNLLAGRINLVPESVTKKYDDAVLWLEKVSKGTLVLPATANPATTTSRSPVYAHGKADVDLSTSDRVFTRGSMSGL